ncbi:ribonuclease HII [Cytobacillus sp. FJAT-54145]|uniref:Ribonuclease HII n=1 Tax=Cytobacillus spartinae TaxID=3299023 RepID=A0ABW6K4H4_9BACI
MNKLTISQISDKLLLLEDLNHPFLKELKSDERKGVQQLLQKWLNNYEKTKLVQEKFVEMTYFENKYRKEGFKSIAGIDEVGRGPLAGPVVAAAVILPETFYLPGIDDSKKLTEQKREEFFSQIQEQAEAINVGVVDAGDIDTINIYEATKKAMLLSIQGLSVTPDFLLIDAMKLETPFASESIIKGDARSISISAASIIAKVTRDRMMKQIDLEYPQYGFARNMGYGTSEHLTAIQKFGVTPYHRRSFAPVREALSNE